MTAKAALADALIKGKTINIKNGFSLFGLTNVPREVSRQIERPFGVRVTRIPREGKSRYGQSCTWYDYKLDLSEENRDGIKAMIDYVHAQSKIKSECVITKTLFE
jgi:hypothetical protein